MYLRLLINQANYVNRRLAFLGKNMFQVTDAMLDLTAQVLARKVIVEVITEITVDYERKILLEVEMYADLLCGRRGHSEAPERILDPRRTHLCTDERAWGIYEQRCFAMRDRMGLIVPRPELDPRLCAETNLRSAENKLLSSLTGIFGVDLARLIGEKRARSVELCMQLLTSSVPKDLAMKYLSQFAEEAGLGNEPSGLQLRSLP